MCHSVPPPLAMAFSKGGPLGRRSQDKKSGRSKATAFTLVSAGGEGRNRTAEIMSRVSSLVIASKSNEFGLFRAVRGRPWRGAGVMVG